MTAKHLFCLDSVVKIITEFKIRDFFVNKYMAPHMEVSVQKWKCG